MNRAVYVLIAGALSLVQQPAVRAGHVDIMPYFVGRTNPTNYTQAPIALQTGSSDFDAPLLNPDDRVFTGTALNYAVGPGWVSTIDPGWTIPSKSSAYPTGTSRARTNTSTSNLSYNVVVDPMLGRNLAYWDGTGTPDFGAVPAGEVMKLVLSSGTVTLDGSATEFEGTIIKSNLSTSSAVHVHWQQRIYGDASLEGADNPTPGFYLFSVNAEINAYNTTYLSDPLYVIMAHGFEKYAEGSAGALAPQMQAARDWVQNTLVAPVPEPSSAVLACAGALGAVALVRRHWKRGSR